MRRANWRPGRWSWSGDALRAALVLRAARCAFGRGRVSMTTGAGPPESAAGVEVSSAGAAGGSLTVGAAATVVLSDAGALVTRVCRVTYATATPLPATRNASTAKTGTRRDGLARGARRVIGSSARSAHASMASFSSNRRPIRPATHAQNPPSSRIARQALCLTRGRAPPRRPAAPPGGAPTHAAVARRRADK